MDGVCQVASVRRSLSDERQVEVEHEDLDWDSFITTVPLHQVLRVSVILIMHVLGGGDAKVMGLISRKCLPSLHC